VSSVPPRPDVPSSWTPSGPVLGPPPSTRPAWRRATFGRVVLHVVIGAALAFGLLVVMLIVVVSSGRTPEQLDAADQRAQAMLGGAFWILLLGAEAGWLLFVYLRASTGMRAAVLLAVGGFAFAVSVSLGLSAIPRIA